MSSDIPNVTMGDSYMNRPTLGQKLFSKRFKVFLGTFIIPNALALSYFAFVATPTYVSHSKLMITNPQKDAESLTTIMAGTSGASSAGAYVFKGFVQSRDEYHRIKNGYDLSNMYASDIDWIRGYGGLVSFFQKNDNQLYYYYKSHTKVKIDNKSGLVEMSVLAPSAVDALNISQKTTSDAIASINIMNEAEERDFVKAASIDVAKAKKALEDDEKALVSFREASGIYDPKVYYTSLLEKMSTLEVKNLSLLGQYESISRETPNNPVALEYKTQMNVFNDHIKKSGNMVNNQNMNFSNYDALTIRRQTDAKLLQQAEMSLQQSEIKASQNHYYVKIIENSSLAEAPERPFAILWMGIIFLCTLVAYYMRRPTS